MQQHVKRKSRRCLQTQLRKNSKHKKSCRQPGEPADGSFFTFTIYFFAFTAASTNPLNSGCGRFGLDFSSG